jgi:hypothetical protein
VALSVVGNRIGWSQPVISTSIVTGVCDGAKPTNRTFACPNGCGP